MNRKWLIILLLSISMSSCWVGTEKIIDDYEVSWGDAYTQGWDGYCIYCNPRIESDEIIEDIKSIQWNQKIIIVEKNNTEARRWFIYIAKGDTLKCMEGDTLKGPFNQKQIDSISQKYKKTELFVREFN